MALIDCAECGNKISELAKACPSCGAKQRPAGMGWFAKLALFLVGAFVLMFVLAQCADADPAFKERQREGRVIEQCIKDMKDPLRSYETREAMRFFCERLRDDYVRKHKREP